jgi:hypothetical protein
VRFCAVRGTAVRVAALTTRESPSAQTSDAWYLIARTCGRVVPDRKRSRPRRLMRGTWTGCAWYQLSALRLPVTPPRVKLTGPSPTSQVTIPPPAPLPREARPTTPFAVSVSHDIECNVLSQTYQVQNDEKATIP